MLIILLDWDEDSTVEVSAQPTSTNKHARGQPGLVASLGQQSRAGHQRENGAGISYGSSGTVRASGHVGQSRDRLNSLQNTGRPHPVLIYPRLT